MSLPVQNLPESNVIVVRKLGLQDYEPLWRGMQQFTEQRSPRTPDEIWYTEHSPVFTLGLNASREHLIAPGDIPVIQVDRGGQVTYHGPGQLMIYPLVDLKRAKLGVRDLVTALEKSVIDFAAECRIEATCRKDAPGVYVDGRKVASVGLRVRRGASYHGMAVNIDPDLVPFSRINPCGFSDLKVTSFAALGVAMPADEIRERIQVHLLKYLRMDARQIVDDTG